MVQFALMCMRESVSLIRHSCRLGGFGILAGDLRHLASAAASTLVTLMTTDAWPQVRNSVAEFWLRYQPPYSADRLAADLDGANATVARARQVKDRRVENAVAAEWEGRILALLILEPAAAGDLAAVIVRLQPQGARPSESTGFHAGRAAGAGSAWTPSRSIRVPITVIFLIVPILLVFGVLGITRLIHAGSSAPAVPQATGLGSGQSPPAQSLSPPAQSQSPPAQSQSPPAQSLSPAAQTVVSNTVTSASNLGLTMSVDQIVNNGSTAKVYLCLVNNASDTMTFYAESFQITDDRGLVYSADPSHTWVVGPGAKQQVTVAMKTAIALGHGPLRVEFTIVYGGPGDIAVTGVPSF